jgi:hypothetical protein
VRGLPSKDSTSAAATVAAATGVPNDSASAQLKLALADYKRVLIQRPTDLDAKWNYELALEKQKSGGGGGGGGGQSNASEAPSSRSRSRSRPSRSVRPSSCWAAPSVRSARYRARSRSRTAPSLHQAARIGESPVLGVAILAQLAIAANGPDTATAVSRSG